MYECLKLQGAIIDVNGVLAIKASLTTVQRALLVSHVHILGCVVTGMVST